MLALLPKDIYICLMATKDFDKQGQDILISDDILEACCGTYIDYLPTVNKEIGINFSR